MDENYRQKVIEWRSGREANIRKENGWLALAGLFWLKLGENRFGSDPECEITLPSRVPVIVGAFNYDGRSVALQIPRGQVVKVNGIQLENTSLQPDTAENPSYVTLDDICMVVIKRGPRMGIRMWDNLRAERQDYPLREWYEIDESFVFHAEYHPYDQPRIAFFPDLTGEKTDLPVDGVISFKHTSHEYSLDVTVEDDHSLFVRFWDPTSESSSYPTGRYLVTDPPQDSKVLLDFNFGYNPPCAFTDFATCVFAPEQNRLDFKILAGETYKKNN